jgi:hypothetical protein
MSLHHRSKKGIFLQSLLLSFTCALNTVHCKMPKSSTQSKHSSSVESPIRPQSRVVGSVIFQNDNPDDDEYRDDTFYEASELRDFSARRVEPDDLPSIKAFLKEEDYDFFKFEDPCAL